MFCPQCGSKNPDVANFCFSCGATLLLPAAVVVANDVPPSMTADSVHSGQTANETTVGKQCPVCGLFSPGIAERCDCGYNFITAKATAAVEEFSLFPVATHKFMVLSICTFGLYEMYWSYQNWLRLERPKERISPLWRAIFAPIWSFALFGRIKERAGNDGIPVEWNPNILAAIYLVLALLFRLPDPWWLLVYLRFVPMIPVQQTAQRHNIRISFANTRNASYTTRNVITIVVGGTLFVLAVVGAFSKIIR
jgi:hypothetical protein